MATLENVKSILCVRLGSLGDILFALHALRLLRVERPDVRVAWAVERRFAGILEGHPDLDAVIVIPRRDWTRRLIRPWTWPGLYMAVRDAGRSLRAEGCDVSIDFHGNLRSGVLTRLAAAPVRIGLDAASGKELNHVFQTVRVHAPPPPAHRITRDLSLLAPLGIAPRYERPLVAIRPSDRKGVAAALAPLHAPGRKLVLIHSGTSGRGALKRWDLGRFGRVAAELSTKDGCDVLFTWGPLERRQAETAASLSDGGGSPAPQTRSLLGLAALIEQADLVIACDTGPLHLAAVLGRPVVGLYGPKDPRRYGPIGTAGRIVTGSADCAPCTRRSCARLTCMRSISVEQVVEAARSVLAGEARMLLPYGLDQA